MKEFRNLTAADVEVRIGSALKDKDKNVVGYQLLLYKNARVDMQILDESVGAENWQRKQECLKNNIYCSVGIRSEQGEWIWKEDCGVCASEDEVIADKGEASDAFKRACTNWGIGRELYNSPFIKVNDPNKFARYEVTEMSVENKEITHLVIINTYTKATAYTYTKGKANTQPQNKPQVQPTTTQPKVQQGAQKQPITSEEQHAKDCAYLNAQLVRYYEKYPNGDAAAWKMLNECAEQRKCNYNLMTDKFE